MENVTRPEVIKDPIIRFLAEAIVEQILCEAGVAKGKQK